MMSRCVRRAALLMLVALASASCGAGGGTNTNGDAPEESELIVLGAASLTEAFTELATTFEARHDGVTASLSFGPSDGLATQIIEGAPADVFASASGTWMDAVEDDGRGIRGRADFVQNELTVITPPDDPAGIESIRDLGEPDVKLVLAAKDVPVGGYARDALANAGIARQAEANVVSNEEDVKAVVQKVLLGEADAGIVYATDLTDQVEAEVRSIPLEDDVQVIATYPIGVVATSENPTLAREFVDLVLSDEGQQLLREHNFLPPP